MMLCHHYALIYQNFNIPRMIFMMNTKDATSGAGSSLPSGEHEFITLSCSGYVLLNL